MLKTNYKNTSKTWFIIREIVDYKNSSNKSNLPAVISVENQIVRTDLLKFLKCLCEFFTNFDRNMSNNLPCSKFFFNLRQIMFTIIHTSRNYYGRCSNDIDSIKSHSAPGKNDISLKFVKLAKYVLSPYLANLFNECIDQEIFPFDF